MKVRAIKNGFYGGKYRYAGDTFHLAPVEGMTGPDKHRTKKIFTVEEQFSSSWMEKVDGRKISAIPAESPEIKRPETQSGSGAPTGEEDVI